jgi:PA domain/PKD-like domain/Secretion system C-terminal sorting domain/Proprotein convertase P-domain/HYR domain
MKKTLLILVALFCFYASWAQKPIVSKAVAFAITAPVRDFGIAKPEPGKKYKQMNDNVEGDAINKKNEERIKEIVAGKGGEPVTNMQNMAVHEPNIPAAITSFDGNSSADNFAAFGSRVYPPDCNGDVGPNHYLQTTNLLVGIYNKSTGALIVPKFKMSTLFASLGAPFSTTDRGDPVVLYDQLADRWLISQFYFTSSSSGVYYEMIAISQTGDPTGAYYVYAFLMPNNKLNDYPHFGVWPDGYYMADNQFTNGATFSGAGAFAFDRAKMLVGDPTASYIYFDQAASCPTCGGQLPTDLDGYATPPVGTPNLFMEFRATEYGDPVDGLRIFAFHADFTTPSNSTFTQVGGTDLPLAAFDARNPASRADIEQPAPSTSTTYLDAISDRLMHRLAYRILPGGQQSFVGNFTVNVSGVNPTSAATFQAGIKWFELRRSAGGVMSVNDEGIYAPGAGDGATGRNIWMAGIAQDGEGNIGLGYSASSTTLHPSILYTGRLTSDPPGTMAQGENTLVAGSGVQLGTANRWGDYSSMSVDPVDECTFWYTQEYYTAASQASSTIGWLTRIGSFKVNPTCVVTNRGTISGIVTNCVTEAPVANAIVTTPDGFFTKTNAAGEYSILVGSGTYTVVITGPAGYSTCTTSNVIVTNGGNTVVNCCIAPSAIIVSAGATLVAETCLPANNVIDPNETVTVDLSLSNIGGLNTTNLVATLQATGGVTNPGGPQNYGVVVGGGPSVSRPFTFTAANLNCGDLITATLQLQDGATNLGTVTYTFITGATSSTVGTFSFTGPAVPIPDAPAAGVNIPITVSGAGTKVVDLNFRFDPLAGCDATAGNTNAAVDHTFISDLVFKLTSPAGTTVTFMQSRGGSGKNICNLFFDDDGAYPAISTLPVTGGVSGNYAPENPFSAFDGQIANGTWTLNVSDIAGADVGSVRGFSIVLTTSTPLCCINVCTPPVINAPTVTQSTCTTPTGTIAVNATGTGALEYSVDNGATWQSSATFSGLAPGEYNIKVHQQATPDCESTYGSNPVVIHAAVIPVVGMSADGPLTFCAGGSVNLGAVVVYPNLLRVLTPYAIDFSIGTASFGANILTTPINGDMVYIPDGTASYLGCNPYTAGSLTGKVALIDRGTCLFVYKAKNAQDAGAIGVIIVNNTPGDPVNMGNGDPGVIVTIPVISVSQQDGAILKNMIANGTTNGNTLAHTYSYLWSNGATTQSIPVTQSGTFSVQITDENGCSATTAPETVTVNPIPNAVATPSSQSICTGSAITTIVNSSSVPGTVFNWTRDNTVGVTGIAASGAGDISGSLTNTTNAPITVTFTITPTANNCNGTAITATVVVNPTPNAVATPSSQTICSGNAVTTIVNSGNVASTVYNWTRDNLTVTGIAASGSGNISGSLTNTTGLPVTVTFTITPSYTNAGVTCTGTAITATVVVNPVQYFACPGNMTETITDVICFKAVNTPNPVFCGTLTKLTWKLTGATTLSSPTSGINYLGLRNMNVGTTTVTYTATFTGGVVKTCSFTVLVIETIPPNIRCPLDKDITTDLGKCYKTGPVSLGTPVVSDNCGIVSTTNDAPAVYQKGVNLVTWTVTDKSGNTRTCVQRVTVYDAEKPVITCPANVIVNAGTGPNCNATQITLPNPVFTDNCGVVTLSWAMTGVTFGSSNTPGINYVPTMDYLVGVSTVTYTAIDAAGNAKTCTFTVTVKDVTAPTLVCPAAQTLCKVANNTYTIPPMIQSDNCAIVSTTYKITGATSRTGSGTNASGLFNLGVSTITWTVKDSHGNTSTCTTVVTIVATTNPICTPPPPITSVEPGVNKKYTEVEAPGFSITAWPNPTVNYFNLKVNSAAKETVVIRMYDMAGKLVQVKNGAPGNIYIIGENVTSGMYIIEVSQGANKQKVKLVKLN